MSFISNASNFSLGEGVYNNVHGNIVYNFYGTKRSREEIEGSSDLPLLTHCVEKRRRLEEEDEIAIIPSKHLKLIREIGSGPGYFLHAGRNQGHAAIIKVFNRGPNVRQQLESTVALSKEVIHPNLLRIEGISSPASLIHFIAYEDVHWKNAEGPLAAALKNDLRKSIRLGFKMIAGLSAGLNHLSVQGVSLGSMRVENFDIFLDVDDRFMISVHPRSLEDGETAEFQEPEDNAWIVFNALCQKILMSANRVLHHEQIDRDPAFLVVVRSSSVAESSAVASLLSFGSTVASQSIQGEPPVPPRREYVWRTMNRGQQSLATVARRIALDLDMNLSTIHLLTQSDGQNPHRCPGYIREEIMLATTTLDSVVVAHDTPSPLEICSICHEVVGVDEAFLCICGEPTPGSRHTIKCRVCNLWSHSDCMGNPKEFTCSLCVGVPPEESGSQDGGEYNLAIQYLNKIKARYADDPNTYKQFLDILQTYQKERKHLQDAQVYVQMQYLFKDAPDLLEEFKAFLPMTQRLLSNTGGRKEAGGKGYPKPKKTT